SARCRSWTRSPTCSSRRSTAASSRWPTSRRRSPGCGPSGSPPASGTRAASSGPRARAVRRRARPGGAGRRGLRRGARTRSGGAGMTETTGATARKGGGRRKGLKIQRIFTTPGVHPYDEVEWERRDIVMTNWRDGSVNFEQKGVEFPAAWSMNATQIVASKYFRGAVGTPQREWSLKQLIDRVAGMYTRTGQENGYFATDADAEVFDHELKYALVHQLFSFNSPVWFNVGTASKQQVSACFILSVDDTMESILDWYKEE